MNGDEWYKFTIKLRNHGGDSHEFGVMPHLAGGDRQKFIQSARQLKRQVHHFKIMAFGFRRGLNRVMVLGKLSYRIERFTARNSKRFSDEELATIESNLSIVSQKRVEIKSISRKIILTIRQTFRELMELRREIK